MPTDPPPRLIVSDDLVPALVAAGILPPGDGGDEVARVLIDLKAGKRPVVYIERHGDERLIRLVEGMHGIEVVREDRPEPADRWLCESPEAHDARVAKAGDGGR